MASLQEAFTNMLGTEKYVQYQSPVLQQPKPVQKIPMQSAAALIARQHFFPVNHLMYQKYIDNYYWFENKYNGMQYCHPDSI
jgi:hypothetical protein